MNPPPVVVQIDAAPRPLSYWAELWECHPRTLQRWIKAGLCPCINIGGQQMISSLQLLNWELPVESEHVDETSEQRGGVSADQNREVPACPADGWSPSVRAGRQDKTRGKGKLRRNVGGAS